MAKNVGETLRTAPSVVFEKSNDALDPKEAPWGFIVRNPLMSVVPPGATMKIDLGLAARSPMLAFPARGHADDVRPTHQVFQAGEAIAVEVTNQSKHAPLIVETGEPLLNLHPLVYSGTAEVR